MSLFIYLYLRNLLYLTFLLGISMKRHETSNRRLFNTKGTSFAGKGKRGSLLYYRIPRGRNRAILHCPP